jgi:putative heme-binding domain-containing protein
VNYLLVSRDGQEISGVVTTETGNSVTLLRAGGGQETVLRGNIKTLRSTGLSMMPEGLESGIDAQQMADLIRFLQTYKE